MDLTASQKWNGTHLTLIVFLASKNKGQVMVQYM